MNAETQIKRAMKQIYRKKLSFFEYLQTKMCLHCNFVELCLPFGIITNDTKYDILSVEVNGSVAL